LVAEISAASEEQTQGIGQISQAVGQMDQVTQSSAANAEESASSAEELNAQAEELHRMVQELRRVVGGANSVTYDHARPSAAAAGHRPEQGMPGGVTSPRRQRLLSGAASTMATTAEERIPMEEEELATF
ncbi:MAG: methyl-accepting chemotaxis protein, partial [Phycisphaerales bacterium JB038]